MATTTYGTPYVQSSDLVSSYPGTSSTLATRIDDISLKGNGLNDQTGTSYTLVLTDGGKTVTLSNAAAVAVTIPANASVAFPTGTIVRFVNKGAGTVTISPTGGATLNGGNLTLAQYAAVQIVKLASDTWGVVESTGTVPGLNAVTPTSLTNSGGSASLSNNVATFSGVSSISLNGVFSSTYDHYRFILEFTLSTSTAMGWRGRAAGVDTTTAYQRSGFYVNSGNTYAGYYGGTSQNQFVLADSPYGAAAYDVMRPNLANTTVITGLTEMWDGASKNVFVGGLQDSGTQFTGMTLLVASGTFSGSVAVYGYKK